MSRFAIAMVVFSLLTLTRCSLLAKGDTVVRTHEFRLLAGEGPEHTFPDKGKIGLFTPGMCSSPAKFVPMAKALVDRGIFDAVYGFSYPWPLDIIGNSVELARLLLAQPKGVEIILIGHSMGGVVNRYALEHSFDAGLWESDLHIEALLTFGSPFNGSGIGEAALKQLLKDQATSGWQDPWSWGNLIPESIKQIMPGSGLLQCLAQPTNKLCDITYLCVAGKYDWVVGASSAHHIPDNATLGPKINDLVIDCDHFGYFEVPARVEDIVKLISAARSDTGPEITVTLTNGGIAQSNGWRVDHTLRNNSTTTTFVIGELIIKSSDSSGKESHRQWYDSATCGFQPQNFKRCRIYLPPGGAVTIPGRIALDKENTPYEGASMYNCTKTVDVYVNGRDQNNRLVRSHHRYILKDQQGRGPLHPPHS